MARPLRIEYPGAVYHVTFRGNAGNKIFSGQESRTQRDISINAAHVSHGYTLKEIADHLRIHYTTVSKVFARAALSEK